MDWDIALEVLEKGNGRLTVVTTLLLEYDGALWMSFDGVEWEKADSKMTRRQVVE